jgi:cytochrome c peroxidase
MTTNKLPPRHKRDSAYRMAAQLGVCLVVLIVSGALHAATTAPAPPPPPPLSPQQALGEKIFNDKNLSEPRGTACANCHQASTGFANLNGSRIGVPLGSLPNSFGTRSVMQNSYSSFTPPFSFRVLNGDVDPVGGLFWDGRADTLAQQAQMPFLAANEMNNKDGASVVAKIAAGPYAKAMTDVYGKDIFKNPSLAFARVGEALAAFESTKAFQSFSSRYDDYIAGRVKLTPPEDNGLKVFMDPAKGNCASCHTMNPQSTKPADNLFTDFAHYATGIPRNTAIPANANPSYFDLGLCGPNRSRPALGANVPADVSIEKFCGTFKMPSLRNVGDRQVFMHNGVFSNLRDVVSFYATRDSNPKRWYGAAAVPNDLPLAYQANIVRDRAPLNRAAGAGPALSEKEIDDVVAFLKILSDRAPVAQAPVTAPPPPPVNVAANPFAPPPPPPKSPAPVAPAKPAAAPAPAPKPLATPPPPPPPRK